MANAFDLDQVPTDETIAAAKAAGIVAILLYTRLVTREVVEKISTAGIDVVLIAEFAGADKPGYYTTDQGLADAERAFAAAAEVGMPPGRGIYFCAADYDATAVQAAGPASEYVRAVRNARPPDQGIGAYGNGVVCRTLLDAGIADKAFCWAGRRTNGTTDFMKSGRASIQQLATTTEFGASVDPDEVSGDYWGWRLDVAPAVEPSPEPEPTSGPRVLRRKEPPMTGDDVREIQRRLGGVRIDGVYGRSTEAAVRDFQRTHGLPVDGAVGPATLAMLGAPR